MIIQPENDVDANANSATETTSLKSQPPAPAVVSNAEGGAEPSAFQQPPPPYGVAVGSAAPGPRSPTSANGRRTDIPQGTPLLPQHYGPPPSHPPPPPDLRRRTLTRLLKAYLVAWLVVLLWSLFLGSSIEIHIRDMTFYHPSPIIREWVEGTLGTGMSGRKGDCACYSTPVLDSDLPTTSPIKPLPIFFPTLKPTTVDP